MQGGDFSGTTLIPFATSGGSPLGESGAFLARLCPASRWLPGRRLNAGATERELADWLKQLDLEEGRR